MLVWAHARRCGRIRTLTCAHVRVRTRACAYACARTCACACKRTHAHIHANEHVRTLAHEPARVHPCARAPVASVRECLVDVCVRADAHTRRHTPTHTRIHDTRTYARTHARAHGCTHGRAHAILRRAGQCPSKLVAFSRVRRRGAYGRPESSLWKRTNRASKHEGCALIVIKKKLEKI